MLAVSFGLVSAAAAFNVETLPAARQQLTRAMAPSMGYETELGATGPLGYWDPLGLASKASPEQFARFRAVELKHGRIAMAASTGYIVQSFLRFPGYLSVSEKIKFADLPNGIAGFGKIPPAGLLQILLGIGLMEGLTWKFYEGPWPGKVPEGKAPGDVAGDLWVRYPDPEVKADKLNIELNNGRAAMMGITGMLMHDHLTGSWIPPGF
eukprot:CAMPEP_0119318076 /NCGR_PEP_ID=MMETSP1333-20130426/45369_1 /TAXON_ID=418940 /ORGANISM="Scyphosphaera apsteinii, Strain RCC1455" /LENGTH=208 /DNA_ID=CAMNT_0007324179 /DNA_START=27 /DNA_END=653 /DNA_ORIENTATION=-